MDLLRAVIVGAYGTPYQDGLFFFDFHLPPEYPDVPPVRNATSGCFPLTLLSRNESVKECSDMGYCAAVSIPSFWRVADKSKFV